MPAWPRCRVWLKGSPVGAVYRMIQGTVTHRLSSPKLGGKPVPAGGDASWPRLAAVVLLAGSVRPSKLRKASGRCGLELPVASHRTVFDCWLDELKAVAAAHDMDVLRVRVMVDRMTRLAPTTRPIEPLALSIEQDPSEFRGTAGLLHDLAKGYEDDQYLLVGHGAQVLFVPLLEQAQAMAQTGADFLMVTDAQGVPAGLMLIRCGCLRKISGVGFVDLNEQALPEIAKRHVVRVVRFDRPTTGAVRTRSAYIRTLRELHRRASGVIGTDPGLEEDWRPMFGLVEDGSQVHERAVVHDSVVLGGARVEPGAVLVRSVVCPGAVVGKGQSMIDAVVDGGIAR